MNHIVTVNTNKQFKIYTMIKKNTDVINEKSYTKFVEDSCAFIFYFVKTDYNFLFFLLQQKYKRSSEKYKI